MNTNGQKPVNVLAWFDDYIRRCGIYDDGTPIRVALAELIEKADNAARILHNAIEAGQLGKGYATSLDDLRAALARVGGAA